MTSDIQNPGKARLAFVKSNWHEAIVQGAHQGFLEVAHAGVAEVGCFTVPGAFELPLHARLLADTGQFDAIVAAGLVVDGGIYRHEFVAEAVIGGLMRVQLDTGIPVLSCVLTPHQFQDHDAHQQFFSSHMIDKGREVAQACLATLAARRSLTTVG